MNRTICFLAMAGLVIMTASAQENITMTGNDAATTTSFNTGLNWPGNVAPVAGNHYFTAGRILRTPESTPGNPGADHATSNHVFAGASLTLNGGTLAWKSHGMVTIQNLIIDGGSLGHWHNNTNGRLLGNMHINSGRTLTISAGEPDWRTFQIFSAMSGSGNMSLQMNQTSTVKRVFFHGDNSAFTGRIHARGRGSFGVNHESGLGANPVAYTEHQLEFGGATLLVTNTLSLTARNRGIRLNNTTDAVNHIFPGGVIEVTTGNTATIACVINGAGPLTKRGEGVLILATNNVYTGLTTVEAGRLWLDPRYTTVSSQVVVTGATAEVAGGGSLGSVTLVSGGALRAEGNGWDVQNLSSQRGFLAVDLAGADPAVARFRVAGLLSKEPITAFAFTFNTNHALFGTAYRILSAPNLAAWADHDFCVHPPWIGELSRADDGAGGQVLMFTPTPPADMVFKAGTDLMNDTGWTNSLWSSGAPPVGGKTYVFQAGGLRTPQTGSHVFPGRRLLISGVDLTLKGPTGVPTIEDLTMMNDAGFGMAEGAGSRMAGRILLHPVLDPGRSWAMRITGSAMQRHMDLFSTLAGYGDLFLQGVGDPAFGLTRYTLHALNTSYTGRIRIQGNTNFWLRIASEANLGGNPALFRADQLTFNGSALSVTNNVTLDDSNRGITLMSSGGVAGTTTDWGGYPAGTPEAVRRHPGGGVFRPEAGSALTILCPITGPGALIKNGLGRLALGGNNNYTGLTDIVQGALEPMSASALGTGPLRIRPEGRLLRRHPGPALPDGVALASSLVFEPGSAIRVEREAGAASGNFTLPLFTMPTAAAPLPGEVPLEHDLRNFRATVFSEDAGGGRTRFWVRLAFQGTLLILQ